jgi:O-6-methylguanine DNA methyltransferase
MINWGCGVKFKEKVYSVVKTIPKGETLSYGEVAILAGHPGAARAVGNILSQNFDPKIPCHRVIRADGKPGGYNRGRERKSEILETEKDAALKTRQ